VYGRGGVSRAALYLAIAALAATGCGGDDWSVWSLEVPVPSGWTRTNVTSSGRKGRPGFRAIDIKPPSAEPHEGLHIYVTQRPAHASARARFDYMNDRHWNNEVTIVEMREDRLADGWVATYWSQTLIRPTPDLVVVSLRRIHGHDVECILSHTTEALAAIGHQICASYRQPP
jgi:hypothetical protein